MLKPSFQPYKPVEEKKPIWKKILYAAVLFLLLFGIAALKENYKTKVKEDVRRESTEQLHQLLEEKINQNRQSN